jgi:hypothetical protein
MSHSNSLSNVGGVMFTRWIEQYIKKCQASRATTLAEITNLKSSLHARIPTIILPSAKSTQYTLKNVGLEVHITKPTDNRISSINCETRI